MLYHLLYPLHDSISAFNVFRYLTFRSIAAALTALLIAFVLGPMLIRLLEDRQIGQTIRDDPPDRHQAKAGTPTMGGVLILLAITISTLLWADLSNSFVWIVLFITIGYGAIGFDTPCEFVRDEIPASIERMESIIRDAARPSGPFHFPGRVIE